MYEEIQEFQSQSDLNNDFICFLFCVPFETAAKLDGAAN
jgi:hypothetical protein